MKALVLAMAILASAHSQASEKSDIVCSYAPSRSKAAAAVTSAAGGSAAAAAAVAQATGTAVVAHSSGAFILTGSGGYIAGTLGTAIVGPTIVAVGLIVGGAAVTVELLCAPKNHPNQVAKVKAAAAEFARRTKGIYGNVKTAVASKVTGSSLAVKSVGPEAEAYAFGK